MAKLTKFIAKGAYSKIYEDPDNPNNVIKYTNDSFECTIKECCILSILDHPNIVSANKISFTDHGSCKIYMKKYNNDLFQLIKNKNTVFTPFLIIKITHGLLYAVNYLHSYGIAHGDIKPANILLTDDNTPVLCDFNISAMLFSNYLSTKIQTKNYRAPEVDFTKNGGIYDEKIDIWSIGCILFEMFCGKRFIDTTCLINNEGKEELIEDTSIDIYNMTIHKPENIIMDKNRVREHRMKYINNLTLHDIVGLIMEKLKHVDTQRIPKISEENFMKFLVLMAGCLIPNPKYRFTSIKCLKAIEELYPILRRDYYQTLNTYENYVFCNRIPSYFPKDHDKFIKKLSYEPYFRTMFLIQYLQGIGFCGIGEDLNIAVKLCCATIISAIYDEDYMIKEYVESFVPKEIIQKCISEILKTVQFKVLIL
jgi:serine/threonine protein kinase